MKCRLVNLITKKVLFTIELSKKEMDTFNYAYATNAVSLRFYPLKKRQKKIFVGDNDHDPKQSGEIYV